MPRPTPSPPIAAIDASCRMARSRRSRSDPRIAQTPFEMFARSCAAAIHAVLIERDMIVCIGGFDTSLRTCEDWDLWQRAARMGGRWVHVDAPLSYYRASEHSLTQDVDQMLADAAIVIARGFAADERLADANPAHPGGASTGRRQDGRPRLCLFRAVVRRFRLRTRRNWRRRASRDSTIFQPPPILRARSSRCCSMASWSACAPSPHSSLPAGRNSAPSVTALVAELGRLWNDPVAARRVQYRFERLVLDYDDLAAPRHLSLTLGLRVDLRDLTTGYASTGSGPSLCLSLRRPRCACADRFRRAWDDHNAALARARGLALGRHRGRRTRRSLAGALADLA